MSTSTQVHDAAAHVWAASGDAVGRALNNFLRAFIGWPFAIDAGVVRGLDGQRSETFVSVIHVEKKVDEAGVFRADDVAAVIDATDTLDVAGLRDAYRRVATAKSLKKSPPPDVPMTTTVTMGIVLAARASVPLELLAEEVERLNLETPGGNRLDMVVVASTGIISYAVQFPGEGVSGDFMPPAAGALDTCVPAWYVLIVIRPAGDYSLNKMLSLLLFHLSVFSPGAKLPAWAEVNEGVVPHVLTVSGYQHNLAGELMPVPRKFYNDRYIAPLPVHIESQSGEHLASVQFLPWQDGGAILLHGKLPLGPLLLFLGEKAKRGGVTKLKASELSYVMPITEDDFRQMLERLHKQSNLNVRAEQPNFIVKKFADEGSSSPFIARLMISVFFQRGLVFPTQAEHADFDKAYDVVLTSLFTARTEMQEIVNVWRRHKTRVESGAAAQLRGLTIHVNENADPELKQHTDAFLTASTRALKQGMQGVARSLGVDIGFLFQKEAHFKKSLAVLAASDAALADYLDASRLAWSERLVEQRNDVEHNGWTLPGVVYTRSGNGVNAVEPNVGNRPVTEFVTFMFDRVACFVEDVTMHALKRKRAGMMSLTEIPLGARPQEKPERFRATITTGGMPEWVIVYHASRFEDT